MLLCTLYLCGEYGLLAPGRTTLMGCDMNIRNDGKIDEVGVRKFNLEGCGPGLGRDGRAKIPIIRVLSNFKAGPLAASCHAAAEWYNVQYCIVWYCTIPYIPHTMHTSYCSGRGITQNFSPTPYHTTTCSSAEDASFGELS